MKSLFFKASLLVFGLFSLALLESCGNTTSVPPANNIYVQDTGAYTGRLIVNVYRFNGNSSSLVAGAEVAIFATYQDLQNDIFLSQFQTGSSGQVDFGFLNYGNYYIRARIRNSDGSYLSRIEIAQIQSGIKLDRNIYLQ